MAGMLRILVVDDHEMFSEALALLLGARPASSSSRCFRRARTPWRGAGRRPSTWSSWTWTSRASMGSRPPGGSAPPHPGRRCGAHRQTPSLIISAMAAGACGNMPKTRAADDLVEVVRRAPSEEIVMSDDELPIVLDELRTGREPTGLVELALRCLTACDTEILRALASGEARGEIAHELGISPVQHSAHQRKWLVGETTARGRPEPCQLGPPVPLPRYGGGKPYDGFHDGYVLPFVGPNSITTIRLLFCILHRSVRPDRAAAGDSSG
jgi:hypothetical protein